MLSERNIMLDLRTQKTERDGRIFHTNGNQNRVGVALIISDKIDFN